jgi:hypothetical protein
MGVTDLIALGFVVIFGSATIVTVARIAAKWHREAHGSPEIDTAHEERIARLEQAVEALTVDSGRLIEGPRYLSQLLTERSAAGQPVARIDRA